MDQRHTNQPQNGSVNTELQQSAARVGSQLDEIPSLDPQTTSAAADLQSQITTLPQEANDIDLIEKEWVIHLKLIVGQTADNPYLKQQEISKAKADYMRKRYNKDIKVAES